MLLLQNVRIKVAKLKSTRVNWSKSVRVKYSIASPPFARSEGKETLRQRSVRGTPPTVCGSLPRRAGIV